MSIFTKSRQPMNSYNALWHRDPNTQISAHPAHIYGKNKAEIVLTDDISAYKWVAFGDSLTATDGAYGTGAPNKYHSLIADACGITTVAQGVGGSGYATGDSGTLFCQRLAAAAVDTAVDVVTIFGAYTDNVLPLDTETDVDTLPLTETVTGGASTYAAYVNECINQAHTKYPNAQIVLVNELDFFGSNNDRLSYERSIREAIVTNRCADGDCWLHLFKLNECAFAGLEDGDNLYADTVAGAGLSFGNGQIDNAAFRAYYTYDNIGHPNDLYHRLWLAPVFAKLLSEVLGLNTSNLASTLSVGLYNLRGLWIGTPALFDDRPLTISGDGSVTFNGAVRTPIAHAVFYGASHQNTYVGRNLLPPDIFSASYSQRGLLWEKQADGSLHVTGTITSPYTQADSDSAYLFPPLPNGSYTILNPTENGVSFYCTYIYIRENGYRAYVSSSMKVTNIDLTKRAEIFFSTSSTDAIDTIIKPFIMAGSHTQSEAAALYEPYVGGAPSPSVAYPQPVLGNNAVWRMGTQTVDLSNLVLSAVGNVRDEFDAQTGLLTRRIGVIPSYAGETVTGDYLSTTGGLDTGATVYYVLASPVQTQETPQPLVQAAGTNTLTQISGQINGTTVSVDYYGAAEDA